MGYVAVTGGQEAIQAPIQLLKEYRSKGERPVDLQGPAGPDGPAHPTVSCPRRACTPHDYARPGPQAVRGQPGGSRVPAAGPTAAPCPATTPPAPSPGTRCTSGGGSAPPLRTSPADRSWAPPMTMSTGCWISACWKRPRESFASGGRSLRPGSPPHRRESSRTQPPGCWTCSGPRA